MRLIHNLTHSHMFAKKDAVGEFLSCGWRFSKYVDVMFRPDLEDAGWHEVRDDATMKEMMAADSAHAAMTLLRASQEG